MGHPLVVLGRRCGEPGGVHRRGDRAGLADGADTPPGGMRGGQRLDGRVADLPAHRERLGGQDSRSFRLGLLLGPPGWPGIAGRVRLREPGHNRGQRCGLIEPGEISRGLGGHLPVAAGEGDLRHTVQDERQRRLVHAALAGIARIGQTAQRGSVVTLIGVQAGQRPRTHLGWQGRFEPPGKQLSLLRQAQAAQHL